MKWPMRRVLPAVGRAAKWALLAFALPWIALALSAAFTPLPKELREDAVYAESTRLFDRDGNFLKEVRAKDGARARWVPLDEVSEDVKRAILAAEDRRFHSHPGVDPLAMGRAILQAVSERKIVSGASTLTQQLARQLVARPRTFAGKFREMSLALRIEWSLSKDEILEQYLNRAPFGPNLRGIEAASRFYFDKPSRELSLAQAASLGSLPRGPSLYDPRKGTTRLERRRNRILDRMLDNGVITNEQAERAKAEAIVITKSGGGLDVLHFAEALLSGKLEPSLASLMLSEVRTTLDARLQREVEAHVLATVRGLKARNVSAAAVVVLDNASAEVLAYAGSHDFFDTEGLGANDGVLALRQPGSALKPFVYELAFQRLAITPATLLPDIETHIAEEGGIYRPRNYDGRFHGPIRVREALASSYNVPAVHLAEALGPDRVLERLRALGFESLDRGPSFYGPAIALGDGEVRLIDLANAYATLARGGLHRAVRVFKEAVGAAGDVVEIEEKEEIRVLDEVASSLVTDILKDPMARLGGFGERNVLELPFPVAVKTGTSKAYRDNLTVGFTPDVTVAVWVGNFDGSPMQGISGVTGAGPLFHAVMLAAAGSRETPFGNPRGELETADICALSGAKPTDACPHRVRELFARGTVPELSCDMHERVRIDRRNGLRAGPRCASEVIESHVFERYPPRFDAWAKAAGRPIAPDNVSPHCPVASGDGLVLAKRGRIVFPVEGARFELDPSAQSRQTLRIRAEIPADSRSLARFVVDGREIDPEGRSYIDWPLSPGRHRVKLVPGDAPEVSFAVSE